MKEKATESTSDKYDRTLVCSPTRYGCQLSIKYIDKFSVFCRQRHIHDCRCPNVEILIPDLVGFL